MRYFVFLTTLILLFPVFNGCENPTKESQADYIENIDVFAISESERRNRINDIYRRSREISLKKYPVDSSGGYRVKALLLQLEFSILTYSDK